MNRRILTRRRSKGAAAVELAFALTFILSPLLVGLMEAGRIVEVQQILANAAREGGRQASTGQLTNAQAQLVVTNYVKYAGLTTTNLTVTIANQTNPGVDASSAAQLDQLVVTVTIPYSDVCWASLQLITNATTTVVGKSTWYSMKDKPYPTPPTSPSGA